MAVDKLERLMNLVAALLHTTSPLTAAELQNRVGGYSPDQAAFQRQFSRDKNDLREMGVPILIETVPTIDPPVTGYRIDPDEYYLADPGLDADELAALHLATRLVAVGGEAAPRGLFKLGGLTARSDRDTPPWASVPSDRNLGRLFDGIHRRRSVSFAYRGHPRRFVPRALGFRNGNWYVTGRDQDLEADRVYRLDRIDGDVVVGEVEPEVPRGRSELGPLQPWQVGGSDALTVQVRVDPVAVPTFTTQVGDGASVDLEADGSARVTLEVTNRDGFRTWILGFGATVEVTGPAEVRADLVEWLDRIPEVGP